MKNVILILLIVGFHSLAFGQDTLSRKFKYPNAFHAELGGNGLFYSVNYERILINKSAFKIATQVGFSYYPPDTGIRDFWIPVTITEIWPFGNHHFELGVGYIFIREASRDFDNDPVAWNWTEVYTGRIGYRYQVPDKRFIFRAAITPFMEVADNSVDLHPGGGVSFGYSF